MPRRLSPSLGGPDRQIARLCSAKAAGLNMSDSLPGPRDRWAYALGVAARGRWPLMLRTGWLAGGAADDLGVGVGQFDGEGGFGDEHGDGLVFVGAAEGDFLAADHDHAGVAGAALHPDRFDRGARWWSGG